MESVLIKAGAFILIIVLGYTLKRIGLFQAKDFKILSQIVMKITLPAAVINSFSALEMPPSLLILIVLGILCNLATIFGAWLTNRRQPGYKKAFDIINASGYNIGCFTLPYVQAFLGPLGVVACCLFDAGNALLCTGGSYSIASCFLDTGEKTTVKSFLKKCFSSVPLDVYIIMLIFSFFHIPLPSLITTLASTAGAANGFLAMLMIGIGFELTLERSQIKNIAKIMAIRYGISLLLAPVFYFCLPLPLEVRQVLTIVIFAPVGSAAPIFTEKCGGDVGLAAASNSISILIGITAITSMLMVMFG